MATVIGVDLPIAKGGMKFSPKIVRKLEKVKLQKCIMALLLVFDCREKSNSLSLFSSTKKCMGQ